MLEKLEKKQFTFEDSISRINISYYKSEKKINGELFRKYFIFDIREMTSDKISIIFNDFDKFNNQLLENEFFSSENKNIMVLFLYSQDKKYDINTHRIMYNMEFALKKFVTEDELYDIIFNNSIDLDCDTKICTSDNDECLYSGFNLLYGLNGCGKSQLIFDFYSKLNLKSPIFNMCNDQLNLVNLIQDKSLIEMYLKKLNELNGYNIKSNIGDYLYRLSQILAFSQEQKNIVLLDDMCWGTLDDRNQINVLDTLFEYSCDSSPVVVTSCQSNVKKLVKNRVYKPNIIEVSRKI